MIVGFANVQMGLRFKFTEATSCCFEKDDLNERTRVFNKNCTVRNRRKTQEKLTIP